jgi:hypothetical protein
MPEVQDKKQPSAKKNPPLYALLYISLFIELVGSLSLHPLPFLVLSELIRRGCHSRQLGRDWYEESTNLVRLGVRAMNQ